MWIKKSEYESMKNDIMDLKMEMKKSNELINMKIKNLLDIHKENFMNGTYYKISHNAINIQTKEISNLTLEELARYVIDKEPIVRENTITVKKIYE